jgi:exosortase/archaeosortase
VKKASRFLHGLAQLISLIAHLRGTIFTSFMIDDCILIQAYDEMAIYIFMLLFCMYFGMLMEKKNFDGGAGTDFIAMAIFVLFVPFRSPFLSLDKRNRKTCLLALFPSSKIRAQKVGHFV